MKDSSSKDRSIGDPTAIEVLVVDDSALVRRALSNIIRASGDMVLLGEAADPYHAAEHIAKRVPDVMILDVEMPRMDGITFLRKVMRQHPIPTVICSSSAGPGSRTAMDALALGAVEVIHKAQLSSGGSDDESHDVARAIRAAALAGRSPRFGTRTKTAIRVSAPKIAAALPTAVLNNTIIAIGASTGGTEALKRILVGIPRGFPGIVVVQHMPPAFTRSFSHWLDDLCELTIREAEHRDPVQMDQVLIAPGGRHLRLKGAAGHWHVELDDAPPVTRHRPSVDVLFSSVADVAKSNAIGVILTGMGDDGAVGMAKMKSSGAYNLAQDEASCVVFGMPREAICKGGTSDVVPLDQIAKCLRAALHRRAAHIE